MKKFAPNLKWLAFELDDENFKLLRINTILNDLEVRAILVNCALGDKFDKMTLYVSLDVPAANRLFKSENNFSAGGTVKVVPLDAYLAENKIDAQEVKYIWIDVEGYEAQILLGAKNLLKKNPVPIFMEFNPTAWNAFGCFERMMNLLKEVGYTHWIWVLEMIKSGEEKVYPLDKLWEWKDSNTGIDSQGDIFLIRKGAVD